MDLVRKKANVQKSSSPLLANASQPIWPRRKSDRHVYWVTSCLDQQLLSLSFELQREYFFFFFYIYISISFWLLKPWNLVNDINLIIWVWNNMKLHRKCLRNSLFLSFLLKHGWSNTNTKLVTTPPPHPPHNWQMKCLTKYSLWELSTRLWTIVIGWILHLSCCHGDVVS